MTQHGMCIRKRYECDHTWTEVNRFEGHEIVLYASKKTQGSRDIIYVSTSNEAEGDHELFERRIPAVCAKCQKICIKVPCSFWPVGQSGTYIQFLNDIVPCEFELVKERAGLVMRILFSGGFLLNSYVKKVNDNDSAYNDNATDV